MGSGKSSVVSNTALVNPGAVLLATSELLGKSSFYLLQQNKKKLSPFTKIKFAIFVF